MEVHKEFIILLYIGGYKGIIHQKLVKNIKREKK